jgi:hypothetical protein
MKFLPIILSLISAISFGLAIYFIFMNTNQFNNKKRYNKTIIISLILLAISLVIISYTIDYLIDIYKEPQVFNKDFSKIGTYGDFFGGILNPILAFIGIIAASLAFYAQYEANRQVQDQFEEQKKKDYVQNFESNFYNLLSIHHQIVQDIDYYLISIYNFKGKDYRYIFGKNRYINDDDEKISKSRDVFKNSFRLLHVFLKHETNRLLNNNTNNDNNVLNSLMMMIDSEYKTNDIIIKTKFNEIYNSFYIAYDSDYGHYYRSLYRLIKIVDEKKFSDIVLVDYKIKYSYISIVRSQLSDAETKWLFLNCLSDKGYKKFKPLVEKYSILKIINLDDEVFKYFSMFYLNSAFNNPTSDELINEHLKIDFYNNTVFNPNFKYHKVKIA